MHGYVTRPHMIQEGCQICGIVLAAPTGHTENGDVPIVRSCARRARCLARGMFSTSFLREEQLLHAVD